MPPAQILSALAAGLTFLIVGGFAGAIIVLFTDALNKRADKFADGKGEAAAPKLGGDGAAWNSGLGNNALQQETPRTKRPRRKPQ